MNNTDDEFDNLEDRIDAARHGSNKKKKKSKKAPISSESMQGIHAGIEFVASVIIPPIIGWKIDEWLNTTPTFFIILLFLGIFGGFYSVYKISKGLGSAVGTSPLPEDEKTAKTSSKDETLKN